MRKKLVTRDEVRLDHNFHFCAVPANAFRPGKRWPTEREPIPALWKPLLRQIAREQKAYIEGPLAEMRAYWQQLGIGGDGPLPEPPTLPHVDLWRKTSCRHCGRGFYRIGKYLGHVCSEVCARKAALPGLKRKIARQTAARSKKRAEARAGRSCLVCGEPMEAKRSTKRYCSERCRVAAHRNGGQNVSP